MATETHTITDIPTQADVEKVKDRLRRSALSTEPPPEITVEGPEDGPWTVIGVFTDDPGAT